MTQSQNQITLISTENGRLINEKAVINEELIQVKAGLTQARLDIETTIQNLIKISGEKEKIQYQGTERLNRKDEEINKLNTEKHNLEEELAQLRIQQTLLQSEPRKRMQSIQHVQTNSARATDCSCSTSTSISSLSTNSFNNAFERLLNENNLEEVCSRRMKSKKIFVIFFFDLICCRVY